MDRPSLVVRLVRGLGGQSLLQLSTVVVRLVEVPMFLSFWSMSRYGEWLIISATTTYLVFSDFGMSQCINRQIIMAAAGKNYESARQYLWAGSLFSATTSLIASITLVGLVAAGISLWGGMPYRDQGSESELLLAVALLSLSAVVSLQTDYWLGVLASSGRYALGLSTLAFAQLGNLGLIGIALFLGGGVAVIAASAVVCQVFALLFVAAAAQRASPWVQIGAYRSQRFGDVRTLFNLWRPAIGIFGLRLQQAINADFLRLVIAAVANPVAVVIFTTHSRLARFLTLAARLSYPLQVEMGVAYGANDIPLFRKIAEINIVLSSGLALFLAVAEICIGYFFFQQWTRGAIDFDASLFSALLLGALLEILANLALVPFLATNQYFDLAFKTTVVAALMLPFAAAFGAIGGVLGVAVAQMIAQAVSLAFYFGPYERLLKTKIWSSLRLQS